MKELFKILILVIGIWVCDGCVSANREEMALEKRRAAENKVSFQEIDGQFAADVLSPETLTVFEKRALQKLEDFYGYLNIIVDSSYDTTFRKHAIGLAQQLFDDQPAYTFPGLQNENGADTLGEVLTRLYGGNFENKQFTVKDSKVTKKLSVSRTESYQGTLSYQLQIINGKRKNSELHHMEIEVLLKKIDKKFGEEKERVWEVLLDDGKLGQSQEN